MADNITYRFIQNVGDYFPSGYFTDDFINKVQSCAGYSADDMKALCSPYVQIRGEYEEYKNFIINAHARKEDEIKQTHDWHTTLLKKLGYDAENAYQEPYVVKDGGPDAPTEIIPVRHIIRSGDHISMLIMEMQNLITVNDTEPDGLFKQQYEDERASNEQRYYAGQWRQVIPSRFLDREKYRFSPAIINKAITQIFLMPEERRPHYILMLAGNTVFLFEHDKWARGAYLQLSLDELYFQGLIKNYRLYFALFHLLCCKDTLAADGQTVLMDTLIEESYKNAYEVTKDLKEGVIFAVETLANEALYYMHHVANKPFGKYIQETDSYDETDDDFETEVKDDCLTIVYRLLFLFYAESREELEILPTVDEVYKQGYSLESLRDLEMMRLNSQSSRDGYFFDDSIHHLFSLLAKGHHVDLSPSNNKSFRVRPIDSPLFNDKNLHHLGDVKIRNIKWQEIIRALSLSKKKNYCGRISYANLGVNQLGSVYESLLAYRGFYAEEDYIEVHKANEPQDGTFLVPYSRMSDFDISEVLCNQEGEPVILPKGTFVYRLNGRDRQKSASYYTPEVLTRSTVKYTLKSIIDEVRENKRRATELLELKILEPAMGAAAFQNEVINQLSEAYLLHQQRQLREKGIHNWRIAPDHYRDELQKVKAYIATHNVYGVDLNPTAIELGKLSLWLNVIHKDMETPFFANRLTVGNAVIGAWLKVYSKNQFYGISDRYGSKLKPNKWWECAPHKVKFFKNSVNRSVNEVYHFLLPDANMLGVRSIKEQKKLHPNEDRRMTTILKDWTAPIGAHEFQILQRISAKIDILLKEHFTDQLTIEKYTNNRKKVWDGIDHSAQESLFKNAEQVESYAQKQRLFDTRYGHNNAYRKLKLVMDYWCALWFWSYDDTLSLPTREEYWKDIEVLLAVDNDRLDSRTRLALERTGKGMLAEDDTEFNRISEEDAQIVARTQEELLTESRGSHSLFANDDPMRFKIVARLSERYHFFHPMLEFLEVFWLRDGFDIICGNPPWLKYTFKDEDVLQEKYPEVVIHKHTSELPTKEEMFKENPYMLNLYRSEQIEVAASGTFMNSKCNYPLLVGQQTNLYKCILENAFSLLSDNGIMGMLHPETIYDEPNGQVLRKEVYKRLKYHFRFRNSLMLFAEVRDQKQYSINIYTGNSHDPSFDCIFNLYHPSTIDACFASDGHEKCYGIKIEGKDGKLTWNLRGHKNRIIHFNHNALLTLSKIFEDSEEWETTKLGSIYVRDVISSLERLALFPKSVKLLDPIITEGFHSTNSITDGTLRFEIKEADINKYEMIYSGPNIYVGTAFYKSPRIGGYKKSDFDIVDLTKIDEDYVLRTRYVPNIDLIKLKSTFQSFSERTSWQDYYKVGYRKMLNQTGDRTLNAGILIKKSSHVNGVISAIFKSESDMIELAGLSSSLVMDFLMKTIASANLTDSRLKEFPLGIQDKYKSALFSRTLMLNCLTKQYAELWENNYDKTFKQEKWSLNDSRLHDFCNLDEKWTIDTPLRNEFERRIALVEIDVIVAMAMGFTLQELITIYESQFDVLQKNEQLTFFDTKGNIVYTKNAGLLGVGVETSTWEQICGNKLDDDTYDGNNCAHQHTVDAYKNTLYGGEEIIYYPPYQRQNRVEDYRLAWAHFEKIFK